MSSRRVALLWLCLMSCDDDAPSREADTRDASPSSEPAPIVDANLDPHVASMDAAPQDAAPILDAAPIARDASPPSTSCADLNYDNYGAEFLYLWCLSCHAKQEPTFTTPELVRQWAPAMRIDAVDRKTMPPSGNANYLRDSQREEFGRWLACGAP
jgi:hypothetical protein